VVSRSSNLELDEIFFLKDVFMFLCTAVFSSLLANTDYPQYVD